MPPRAPQPLHRSPHNYSWYNDLFTTYPEFARLVEMRRQPKEATMINRREFTAGVVTTLAAPSFEDRPTRASHAVASRCDQLDCRPSLAVAEAVKVMHDLPADDRALAHQA